MPALSTWAPEDGVLGAVAPLALAASARLALVVDLDPSGPAYPGSRSLAQVVRESPRRAELEPAGRGTAVLANGGVAAEEAAEVVAALVARWPAVVLRLPGGHPVRYRHPGVPLVPFRPLLPGPSLPPVAGPVVWQSAGWRVAPPGPGPVLPRPRAAAVRALLDGVRPPPGRWLRAVARVWGHPWT